MSNLVGKALAALVVAVATPIVWAVGWWDRRTGRGEL